MSHFAFSENPHSSDTNIQVKNFKKAQKIFKSANIHPRWIHFANSSGILNSLEFKDSLGNVARAGIALYGIDNTNHHSTLQPVLKLKTHVAQIKTIQKGDKVGYDFTYIARSDRKIAVLPIGYFDGVDRRLSNRGCVLIKGHECPILGKVSMNITVVDVTGIKTIKIGDEVVVFSDKLTDPNCIQKAAEICNTIPYDLLVHLSSTTKRILQ